MNATTTEPRPEVTAFVQRVRDQLDDLGEEVREELVGGLEADLSDQLADGGVVVLSDPVQYAAELRAAAGLPPHRRRFRRPTSLPRRAQVAGWPDALRARWFALTERDDRTRRVWAFLEAVRPAWWVLRAWVAVTFLDQVTGAWEQVTVVPSFDVTGLGLVLLLGAVVVSVLIGQGRLWPGSGPDRPILARLLLGALTVFAVLVPFTFNWPQQAPTFVAAGGGYGAGFHDAVHRPGLRHGSQVVRNVYVYNAKGHLVTGAQLFDQKGRTITVDPISSMGQGRARQVTCPWFNGATPLFNVFPLPQRTQVRGTCLSQTASHTAGPQALHVPPFASVPPVSLPTTVAAPSGS